MVALEEFAERVEFAVADGEHERVIGALFGGGVQGGGARSFNHGWAWMNTDFFDGGNHDGSGTWLVLPGRTAVPRNGYRNFEPRIFTAAH